MLPKPLILCLSVLVAAGTAAAARRPGEPLKPGFNLFSKQQDVQLGEANSKQVLQQYQVVQNQFLQNYVRRIGARLAEAPEAEQSGFQFTFTVLNVPEINAFALPGGPMFIYSGLLNACDNEAQLAGVMGHEMSHVILRHGTHEATKANLIQLPAMLAGSVIGNEGTMARLANMGLGLGANSFILKFSRDAETEADALGSHLMAAGGYDPVQMARFFEKLAQGPQPPQILSDHPNPGNRERAIQSEVQLMPARNATYQTGEFARMKSELKSVPPPPKKAAAVPQQPAVGSPSATWQNFEGQSLAISYPGNWQVFGDRDSSSVTIAPREGVVSQGGNTQIGYGAILSYFITESKGRPDLRAATDDLIHHLKSDNPRIEVSKAARATKVAGANAMVTMLAGNSPFGGNEVDALVTLMRPQGLFYVVFIAPETDYPQLQDTLQKMLDSLRFQ